jgi:catalase
MDDAQRDRFVKNVAGHLADGVSEPILVRAFDYWRNVDKVIGDRIEKTTRDLIGGTSKAPGMASAKSISGYQGIPATSSLAKGEGRKNSVTDEREVAAAE